MMRNASKYKGIRSLKLLKPATKPFQEYLKRHDTEGGAIPIGFVVSQVWTSGSSPRKRPVEFRACSTPVSSYF